MYYPEFRDFRQFRHLLAISVDLSTLGLSVFLILTTILPDFRLAGSAEISKMLNPNFLAISGGYTSNAEITER